MKSSCSNLIFRGSTVPRSPFLNSKSVKITKNLVSKVNSTSSFGS